MLRITLLPVCAALVTVSGCAEKRARAYPWATAIQVRPSLSSAKPLSAPSAADLAPNFRMTLPPPPSLLEGMRPTPPRPRLAASSPGDSGSGGQDSAPLLAPQLTPQEVAAARQNINESLGIAERNLQAARGRTLNAVQSDLLSKVSGFISESREAAAEGDWTRARNLAKKAQVLSEELATSL